MKTKSWCRSALTMTLLASSLARAGGVQTLEPVEVVGARSTQVGGADSASEGTVTGLQITTRPWLRPAELLETVPGLIVTQHSGDGKANQYFLRGFNLDHGTDFATSVAGVPVNLPGHAHGQGYIDLNFLIPELVETVRYRKGPYSVLQGDFGSAGSASLDYRRQIEPFGELSLGANGYRRALAAGSRTLGPGELLIAAEGYHNDGPWDVPEHYRKANGLLRWSQGERSNGWDVSASYYKADWTATDQVPQRAIDSGLIGRFGSLDPSTGGKTERATLAGQWARRDAQGGWQANAYAVRYSLDLYSNFTYATDDVRGDQFLQSDRRTYFGGGLNRTWLGTLAGRPSDWLFGLTVRQDRIDPVGLHLTEQRVIYATVREDRVTQTALAAYAQNTTELTDWLRVVVGARADRYSARVQSDTPANSGTADETIVTPKFSAVLGPFAGSEVFVNWGQGFHSNDPRGATIRVNPDPRDPEFGNPVDPVRLLVRTRGSELGARTQLADGLQTALALWQLELGSELLFVGDAGLTEPNRPSRRRGVEWTTYWAPAPGWAVDFDLSWSRARFTEDAPEGNFIPGAIETTAQLGLSYDTQGEFFGGLRLRYFGPRPLIEDNSVRSSASTLVNARLGWRPLPRLELHADLINLFNSKTADIEYFYESQLPGESTPVADRHLHPGEPRTLRVTLRYKF